MTASKRCPHCGEVKAVTEFYRDRSSSDGVSSYCRPCATERQALRNRALVRLKDRYPDEFQTILDGLVAECSAHDNGGTE